MIDHITSPVPEYSFTDRERRNLLARIGVGAAIAGLAVIPLLWYVLKTPERTVGHFLLASAVIAAGAAIAWVCRCGDRHEHERLCTGEAVILERIAELQTASEASSRRNEEIIEHLSDTLVATLEHLQSGEKLDRAERLVADAIESIHCVDDPPLPKPAQLHPLDACTPAGARRVPRSRPAGRPANHNNDHEGP